MRKLVKKLTAAAIVEYVYCPASGQLVIRGTNGAQGFTCRRIFVN